MMLLSMPEYRISMSPAAQRAQVETSLASNPRFGPQNITTVLRVLNIIVGVIFLHHPSGVMTRSMGVAGAALLALIYRTRQSRAVLGAQEWVARGFWPIFFPLTPFLCVVNVSITNVAAWRSASMAVAAKTLNPQPKAMSSRWKGVLSGWIPCTLPCGGGRSKPL